MDCDACRDDAHEQCDGVADDGNDCTCDHWPRGLEPEPTPFGGPGGWAAIPGAPE
jgi:hypothetical protein